MQEVMSLGVPLKGTWGCWPLSLWVSSIHFLSAMSIKLIPPHTPIIMLSLATGPKQQNQASSDTPDSPEILGQNSVFSASQTNILDHFVMVTES